jgi:hypothetical protein
MHLPRKRDIVPPVPEVRARLSREDGTFDVESDSVELVARSATNVPSDAPMALDAAPAPDTRPSVPAPPPLARPIRRRQRWTSIGAIALAALVGVFSGQRIRSALLVEASTASPAPASPPAQREQAAPSAPSITFDDSYAPAEAEAEPVAVAEAKVEGSAPDAAIVEVPVAPPTIPTPTAESRTPPFLNYGRTLHRR